MEESEPNPKQEVDTSSDVEKIVLCGACLSADENRPAVKFCLDCSQPICQQCVDSHGKINQTRNHKLVDKVDDESAKIAALVSSCLSCANHPDKNVELVCKDHDVMCCITCVTVGHRNCRQVSEIVSEAKTLIASSGVQDFSKHLDAAKSHIDQIMTLHRRHNQTVESQREVTIPMQVRELKKYVLETLDALEERVQLECDTLALQEINRGLVEMGKWELPMKKLKEATNSFQIAQQSGSDVHVYVAINNIRKTLTDIDRVIANHGNRVVRRSVLFEEGKALRDTCVLVNNVRKALDIVETSTKINEGDNRTHLKEIKTAVTGSETKTGFAQAEQIAITSSNAGFGFGQAIATTVTIPNRGFGCDQAIPTVVTSSNRGFVFGQTIPTAVTNSNAGFKFGQSNPIPVTSSHIGGGGLFGPQNPNVHQVSCQNPLVLASVSVRDVDYQLTNYQFN